MNKPDGGPAFPMPASDGFHEQQSGMSLRDWFAGQAMRGCLANPDISKSAARCKVTTAEFRADISRAAYLMADEMIAAREAQ